MDILIIYSEKKKGELLSLATLLYQKEIRFNPLSFPENWSIDDSEDLLFHLKNNTHSMFLIDKNDRNHPFFVFAAGYCLGSHEKSYLLDIEGDVYPPFWEKRFNYSRSFEDFIEKIFEEKLRWEEFLLRLEAKGALVERGLEVTKTAMIEAVVNGDAQSTELFMKAGFSADTTDRKGVPLICLSVRSNHYSTLDVLLRHGADINLKSQDRDNTALMDAAAEGNDEMIQELIERGAQLDCQSRNGQTALILAIGKGADSSARLLIEAGADAFIADKLGMSAFMYAQLFGRKEVQQLIETHKKTV